MILEFLELLLEPKALVVKSQGRKTGNRKYSHLHLWQFSKYLKEEE